MSTEDNKAVYRRFCSEVLSQGKLKVLDELVGDDVVDHGAVPGQAPGKAGVRQTLQMYLDAFPDLHVTVEDQVAEGDLVASRLALRGTHKGLFMGIPATGKHFQASGVCIDRFEHGKMVESWIQLDTFGLLTQLGVIPAPEPVSA